MFAEIPTYLFQPAATFFVGVVLAVIAFLQFKVAHDKLRLELFDKRYKVYDATKQFLGGIMSSATFSDAQLFTFYAGTSDAEFLFDTDVGEYLLQIRKRALDMRLQAKLYQRAEGDERTRMINAESEHLLWLTDQLTGMSKVYAPYLSYSKVKGDFLEDFILKHQ